MADMILKYLIWLLFTAVTTTLTTVLIPALSRWIASKTQNEKLKSLISDLTATVQISVDHLEQTAVADFKASGEWNMDSQKKVLKNAANEVMNNLLNTTKKTIEDNGIDMQELIIRHIEAYIQSKK